ncbi:MAG: hypothetical protein OSA40_06505 [Phycisphaerales bacterium]|nr:hypothetical protein [Phycisphaerales bacterium]
MPISCRPTSLVLVAILTLTALSTASQAQAPENELARENERLAAQVRDLEATLKAALTRIAELEKSLATAHATAGTSSGAGSTSTKAIEPSNLSPAGLTAAIRDDFKIEFKASGLPELTEASTADERIRYTRWLKKWMATSNRRFRERVSWPVMVKQGKAISSNNTLTTFQPWDVARSVESGKSFELVIPTRSFTRTTRTRIGATDAAVARLDGIFIPAIRLNTSRLEVGPFDNPPFLGSMAELIWRFDFKGLAPEATTPEATTPDATRGTSP